MRSIVDYELWRLQAGEVGSSTRHELLFGIDQVSVVLSFKNLMARQKYEIYLNRYFYANFPLNTLIFSKIWNCFLLLSPYSILTLSMNNKSN